jgi:hypothetical protein
MLCILSPKGEGFTDPLSGDFKNEFKKLSIFNMSILKCVFLYSKSGKFCRFRAASFAGLDRQNLPVWAGNPQLIPVS